MSEADASAPKIDRLTVGISCLGGLLLAGVVAGVTLWGQAMKQSPAPVTLTLPLVTLDPEFLKSHAARVQEVVAEKEAARRAAPPAAEWWKQEVTRFRHSASMIDKQIDDMERAFDDYQAMVAGEDAVAVDIEWEAQTQCEDGVCTTTYPAAERRWEILSDEAREVSTAELSQRHASELKALSGRIDDLGGLLRQSTSEHHEMRGLLAYYGIDPETGGLQRDLSEDQAQRLKHALAEASKP